MVITFTIPAESPISIDVAVLNIDMINAELNAQGVYRDDVLFRGLVCKKNISEILYINIHIERQTFKAIDYLFQSLRRKDETPQKQSIKIQRGMKTKTKEGDWATI